MRELSEIVVAESSGRRSRKWVASALVLASVAVPAAATVLARDKSARRGTESVAKKIDDSTRLGSGKGEPHVLSNVLESAHAAREKARELRGYSATFTKQELTPKKGMIRQTMAIKFRREPFSVYLKFIDPHAGREVIFVEGKNKGRMQVHEPSGIASLAGTISVNPVGDEAMKENRYPIMSFGMEKLMDALILQWEGELKYPESEVNVYSNARIGKNECRMFEVTHPKQRSHFKFKTTRLYIDKASGLPIRVEQYDFPKRGSDEPVLVEEYTYTDIKAQKQPTDLDFDISNQTYGFK
jgi:outer membrane lipoprotein-sorting protein